MEAYNIIRIIVVFISGLSIFLGYRLFYLVTERQGILKIEGKDAKATLSDVGPGVFFALFGSIVLVVTLFTQPYKETMNETTNPQGSVVKTAERNPASTVSSSISTELENLCVSEDITSTFLEGVELFKKIEAKKTLTPIGAIDDNLSIEITTYLIATKAKQKVIDSFNSDTSCQHVYYVILSHLISIYLKERGCQ